MADDWGAFQTAPAATAIPVSRATLAAPAADPGAWAAFAAPPPAPAGGPAPVVPGTDAAAPADTRQTGVVANVGAGGNEAVAGTLGLPVDALTGALNLGVKGLNHFAGTNISPIVNPVGGSESIKRAMGVVGANPDNVRPDGIGEEIARGAGAGVASALLPAGVVAAGVKAGAMAIPTAEKAIGVLGGFTAPNALLGAASGVGSEVAANSVPEEYRGAAGLAGGLLLPAAGLGAAAGVRGAVRGVGDHLAPGMGKLNPLLDESGRAMLGSDGQPLLASSNQTRLAGQKIETAASDPAAVRAAVADPAAPAIPGDAPTTFQLTRDPGLGMLERGMARSSPDNIAAFKARGEQQNDARVGQLRTIAPNADPATVPPALQQFAADADAAQGAKVADVQKLGDATIAAVDQSGKNTVSGLQDTASQVTQRLGGDLPPGSENRVGSALREPAAETQQAHKQAGGQLYDAIDPDGSLTVGTGPLRDAVAEQAAQRTQFSEAPSPLEAEISDKLARSPDTIPFAALRDLQKRLTTQMRDARLDRPEEHRRLSQLLGGVHDSMAAGADGAGTEAAGAGIGARGTDQTSGRAGSGAGLPEGNSGPEQAGGVSERAGNQDAQGPTGGRVGAADSRVSSGTPATERLTKPPSLVDYIIAHGGLKDDGDLKAMGLDAIHHRQGGRLINNKDGMNLDPAVQFAKEHGFIPNNYETDINYLKDRLADHRDGFPTYRPEDEVMARAWHEQQTAQNMEDHMRETARGQIGDIEDHYGEELTQDEREHAVDLVVRHGMHPEEAAQQAAMLNSGRELDLNASRNAVGSPGVPLAAQQATMPIGAGSSGQSPTFDEAARQRLAVANAHHAEGVQTFRKAPGVGDMLAPGPTAGTYKLPDSAVPAVIVRAGPAGKDVANAYLKAGGSPEALSEAAAYSARSTPGVTRPDGTLDPGKLAKWADQRAQFLSATPEIKGKFDAVIAAQKAVDAGAAGAAQQLKEATAVAQKAVDEAMANRAAAAKDMQRSAIGRVMGTADPVTSMGRVLRGPTGAADMRQIMQAIGGNEVAKAGAQGALAEGILRDLKGNTMGATSAETALKNDAFQTFVRKNEAALREVFTPEQMKSVKLVAESLQRSNLSVSGSILPGESATAQNAVAIGAHTTLLSRIGHELAGASVGGLSGATIGATVAGPLGAALGGAVGSGVGRAVQAAREAGIRNVNDLVAQAMLNPQLAHVLLTKATPKNQASLLGVLRNQLGRASLIGANVGRAATPQAPN